jgi:hypothetical protein
LELRAAACILCSGFGSRIDGDASEWTSQSFNSEAFLFSHRFYTESLTLWQVN